MNDFQPIWNVAELCHRKGVEDVVMCPGSRCAPLTLAFTRHPALRTRTISDERSAGFIALGLAQAKRKPVVLICTSGTSVYNFGPSAAEAFFQQVPLIILTADRPAEWIGQNDGQTIFQPGIFGRHVKSSREAPQDYERTDSRWHLNRTVNEMINLSVAYPQGPVHINFPFYEPLYPQNQDPAYDKEIRVITPYVAESAVNTAAAQNLIETWKASPRVLVVAGQHPHDPDLLSALDACSKKHDIPVAADIISNVSGCANAVVYSDLFLQYASLSLKEQLKPDLLITFGESIVSKHLKVCLRALRPTHHWHIQPSGQAADSYQGLTDIIHTYPHTFFRAATDFPARSKTTFLNEWKEVDKTAAEIVKSQIQRAPLSELKIVYECIRQLQKGNLHLANSMSVRYGNLLSSNLDENVRVFSNRGTSGIDGCTSTAVGHAMASDQMNVLISGDMAFFHDRNAFWHNYKLPNLRAVVLNNHGGLIFDLIDGPGRLPENDEYFVTRQALTAAHLCKEYGFEHLKVESADDIKKTVAELYRPGTLTKILELETSVEINRQVYTSLKDEIKKRYES